jgi:hypothetical protein
MDTHIIHEGAWAGLLGSLASSLRIQQLTLLALKAFFRIHKGQLTALRAGHIERVGIQARV